MTMTPDPFAVTFAFGLLLPTALWLVVFFSDPFRFGAILLSTESLSLTRQTSTGTPADSRTSIHIWN